MLPLLMAIKNATSIAQHVNRFVAFIEKEWQLYNNTKYETNASNTIIEQLLGTEILITIHKLVITFLKPSFTAIFISRCSLPLSP